MQFSSLYTRCQNIAFSSQDAQAAKDVTNDAYQDILSRRTWSFLETTMNVTLISAQLEYALTGTTPLVTDFGGNISVSVNLGASSPSSTQWKKLRYLDQQTFDDWLGHSVATTGIPVFYTIYGASSPTSTVASIKSGGETRLALWPTANAALTAKVRYPRGADSVVLSADTDVPILPVRHHFTILLLACHYAYLQEDNALLAQSYGQAAEQRIAAMISEDERMRGMDNQRGTDAQTVHTQSIAQPSPATHDPNSRTYPVPTVGN